MCAGRLCPGLDRYEFRVGIVYKRLQQVLAIVNFLANEERYNISLLQSSRGQDKWALVCSDTTLNLRESYGRE